MSNDEEFECEIRRRMYSRAFTDYYHYNDQNYQQKNDNDAGSHELEKGDVMKASNNNKKKIKKAINLNKSEGEALKSLKKRVADKELIISQTDKSSRFAVLSRLQYLKAGSVHTAKDIEVSWRDIKYIQNQVNSHVWWLNKSVGYSSKTDHERMMKNCQNRSLELPELRLLVKDHKLWSEESGDPVPTRPVASGNCGLNTHLSELISEVLEPIALELDGGEIASTEEMLFRFENLNNMIGKNENWKSFNYLDVLGGNENEGGVID